MAHRYAGFDYMPTLGERPSLEEIVSEADSGELDQVAMHDAKYGTGMYDQTDVREALENYDEMGETDSVLVDSKDLTNAIFRAAMDGVGDLGRFLYADVENLGEYRFHAEGQHKRVHQDRSGETALIEGRDQMYDVADQRQLLQAVRNNHGMLEHGETVRPPAQQEPEFVEYGERPLLMYGFNQSMTPVSELDTEQLGHVEGLLREAEREMREMVESGNFETTQPQDFHFTDNERAKTHALVPSTDQEVLEDLDEVIVGDLGEVPRTYGDDESSRFAIG